MRRCIGLWGTGELLWAWRLSRILTAMTGNTKPQSDPESEGSFALWGGYQVFPFIPWSNVCSCLRFSTDLRLVPHLTLSTYSTHGRTSWNLILSTMSWRAVCFRNVSVAHGIRWWELVPWSRCIKRQRLGFGFRFCFCGVRVWSLERSLLNLFFWFGKVKEC